MTSMLFGAASTAALLWAIQGHRPETTIRVGPGADAETIAGGLALIPPRQAQRWVVEVEPGCGMQSTALRLSAVDSLCWVP